MNYVYKYKYITIKISNILIWIWIIYLQGQCTLINITVNVPELAQKAIFHL